MLLTFFLVFWGYAEPVLLESVLAKINNKVILLTEVQRFVAVNNVFECAGMRENSKWNKDDQSLSIRKYLDEELVYQEAILSKDQPNLNIKKAIEKIKEKSVCRNSLKELDTIFSEKLYKSRRGSLVLFKEIEKRLLIDYYSKNIIKGDMRLFLQEAKSRATIKVYSSL